MTCVSSKSLVAGAALTLALGCAQAAPGDSWGSPGTTAAPGEESLQQDGSTPVSPVDGQPGGEVPADDPSTSTGGSASTPTDGNSSTNNRDDGSFLRAQGHDMVEPDGNKILLRSMNLGGLFIVEAYMWHFWWDTAGVVKHRVIDERVRALLGDSGAAQFWQKYRENYITQGDMDRMKQLGFNSVRLPLNARLLMNESSGEFIESGFADVQRILDMARQAGLYVILDMHAAPGGQTGAKDTDDSPSQHNCPELYDSQMYQDRLVALWKEIATRWSGDNVIGGYDLLNEPLAFAHEQWDECSVKSNYAAAVAKLWPLLQRVGLAIREVDPNHMLIVEGAGWGSDFNSLGQPFDNNMAYSFHFYGTGVHIDNIQKYIDKRNEWNVPLWVGEFGEDTNEHYSCLRQLFEAENIGWGFWTWKRMNGNTMPRNIARRDNWQAVEDYVGKTNGTPSNFNGNAESIFNEYLNDMLFENTSENGDPVGALTTWSGCSWDQWN